MVPNLKKQKHYLLSAQGACSLYELWNDQMLCKRDHVFANHHLQTRGSMLTSQMRKDNIVRLDKMCCPCIFGNESNLLQMSNAHCHILNLQCLGTRSLCITLCRSFGSLGQKLPTEQVMRRNMNKHYTKVV